MERGYGIQKLELNWRTIGVLDSNLLEFYNDAIKGW
jgi:hypothetical protein